MTKPFTPDEERVALSIAQAGADGILDWMRSEGLLRDATTAIVVGFDLSPDGRIVAKVRWLAGVAPSTTVT